jgi:hypothetical protein
MIERETGRTNQQGTESLKCFVAILFGQGIEFGVIDIHIFGFSEFSNYFKLIMYYLYSLRKLYQGWVPVTYVYNHSYLEG